jgi:hypothetical protein
MPSRTMFRPRTLRSRTLWACSRLLRCPRPLLPLLIQFGPGLRTRCEARARDRWPFRLSLLPGKRPPLPGAAPSLLPLLPPRRPMLRLPSRLKPRPGRCRWPLVFSVNTGAEPTRGRVSSVWWGLVRPQPSNTRAQTPDLSTIPFLKLAAFCSGCLCYTFGCVVRYNEAVLCLTDT